MTIEELEQYRGITSEISTLEAEINSLYDVRKSPNGKTGDVFNGTPGDPTGRSAMRIIELKERLTERQRQWNEAVYSVEEWLQTVSDAELRSIIRWHYVLGMTWRETGKRVYGLKNSGDACRKRVKRYLSN